jgi:hypothetical protein
LTFSIQVTRGVRQPEKGTILAVRAGGCHELWKMSQL